MSWIGMLILGALAALGSLELVSLILYWIGKRPVERKGVRIIPVHGKMEELECMVRTVRAQRAWLLESDELIILVDLGMEAESRQIAEYLSHELKGVWLCDPEEISVVIHENFGFSHRESGEK